MSDKLYDHIFIGAGPISILEALSKKAEGKSVLVIDRAARIGGAWGTTILPNGEDVEIGCHIWSISKPVFRFIDNYLELDMKPLKPQPVIYKNGKDIQYDWKSNVLTMRRMLTNLKHGQLKRLIIDWKSPAYRVAFIPSKYLYPVKGASTFSKALETKARQHDLTVLLKTEIEEIRDQGEYVDIITTDGSSTRCKEVHITSVSNVGRYSTPSKSFTPKLNVSNFIHVHFELSDAQGKKISYVRWVEDDVIHRISDITNQAKSDVERLIIVGVYQEAYESSSEEELQKRIMVKLRENNFIGESTALTNWQFNIFPTNYMDRAEFDSIEDAFNGKLKILPSTDLIYGMHHRLKDWNRLLLSSGK